MAKGCKKQTDVVLFVFSFSFSQKEKAIQSPFNFLLTSTKNNIDLFHCLLERTLASQDTPIKYP